MTRIEKLAYKLEWYWYKLRIYLCMTYSRFNIDLDTVDSGCCLDCGSEGLYLDRHYYRKLYSSTTKQYHVCFGHLCTECAGKENK